MQTGGNSSSSDSEMSDNKVGSSLEHSGCQIFVVFVEKAENNRLACSREF